MSRASWPALVGSEAPLPYLIYTRFIDQPATPNPEALDAPQPPDLASILRAIITNALPYGVSTSDFAV
jgi:hypothetical protein